jgi:hypothetical protein
MLKRKLLRPKVVEEIYDIAEGYQAKMRCSGSGPEYIKLAIYYEEAAIERWLDTKRRASTSARDDLVERRAMGSDREAPSFEAVHLARDTRETSNAA